MKTYFYQNFNNDFPNQINLIANSYTTHGIRLLKCALPFISLYKPLEKNLKIATSLIRCYSQLSNPRNLNSVPPAFNTVLTISACVASFFNHRLSLIITNMHDLLLAIFSHADTKTEIYRLDEQNKSNPEAYAIFLQNKNKVLYLSAIKLILSIVNHIIYAQTLIKSDEQEFFLHTSLSLQFCYELFLTFLQSQKSNYPETASHLLMAIIRYHSHPNIINKKEIQELDICYKQIGLDAIVLSNRKLDWSREKYFQEPAGLIPEFNTAFDLEEEVNGEVNGLTVYEKIFQHANI